VLRLPDLTFEAFSERLARAAPEAALDPRALERLWIHYRELARWGARTALVGASEAEVLFERHYAESLAALPLLPGPGAHLLDLGTGAGFPGLILAIARPDLRVTLVEPRERKWAFLRAVVRKGALSCRCLAARVTASTLPEFPEPADVVTLRALRLEPLAFERLLPALAPDARILLWSGRAEPELPAPFRPGRTAVLAGSEARVVREYRRAAGPGR
jgi:16S rRNA (guanine527-N7)-methyltransferase